MSRAITLLVAAGSFALALADRGNAQSDIAPPTRPLPALPPIDLELSIGEGSPLSLDDVLQSVEAHHPAIDAARARLEGAAGARLAAEGGFDPVVSAAGWVAPAGDYRFGRADVSITQPTPFWGTSVIAGWRIGREIEGSAIPEYSGAVRTLDAGEVRGGVVIPLWRDGPIDARRAAIERAERGEDAAQHDLEARILRTRLAAAEAYYRWVAAGLRAQVALDLLRIAEERDRQIATRVAAGAIPAIEHLENRRSILERRQAAVAARRVLERSAIALSLYLRDEEGSPLVVDAVRVPRQEVTTIARLAGSEDELVAQALRDRSERARILELRRAALVQIELAENQIAPRIDLAALASLDIGGEPESRYSQPVLETWVTFQLPLGMREARGRADAARAELGVIDAEAELLEDQIEIEVRDALSAVRASEQALEQALASAEVAEAVAVGERTRFENGATSLLMVNLRESAAAQARASVADAEADLRVARAWLVIAIGRDVR